MFSDRAEAGRRLAEQLQRFKADQPLVLALPRGGVSIGVEIARALAAPLDVVLVRKIGAPFQEELAIGAVADGEHPEMVVNREIVTLLNLPESYLDEERDRQLIEIERRRKLYLAGRSRPAIAGKTAIVVDDGIATGATMRAALLAVRRHHRRVETRRGRGCVPRNPRRLRGDQPVLRGLSASNGFGGHRDAGGNDRAGRRAATDGHTEVTGRNGRISPLTRDRGGRVRDEGFTGAYPAAR